MMLYILLPVHNRKLTTVDFVRCLLAQTFRNFRLVLIDDGCDDGTEETVRELLGTERLVVLKGDGNLWWAGALQMGYEWLRTKTLDAEDAVLIINDDVQIGRQFLETGLRHLEEDRCRWIQAVALDVKTGNMDRGVCADLWRLTFRTVAQGQTANCLSTRGLLIPALQFVRSGGFRPRLLPHYLSDYEFTIRARRRGAKLAYFEDFLLRMDPEKTGFRSYSGHNASEFIRLSFSNKSAFNPVHWGNFVVLCCPPWVVPLHLSKIWIRLIGRWLHLVTRNILRHA